MKKTRDNKKAPYQKPKVKSAKKPKDAGVHCNMTDPKFCSFGFQP